MITVTDRLLADLIAHVTLRTGNNFSNDDRMEQYAAERLALAKQSATVALQDERRHKGDDGGDYGCHKLPAELPRADWIEAAAAKAIDAVCKLDSLLSRETVARMTLDAFIAAMPQGNHVAEALAFSAHAGKAREQAFQLARQVCYGGAARKLNGTQISLALDEAEKLPPGPPPGRKTWTAIFDAAAKRGADVVAHACEDAAPPDPQPEEVPEEVLNTIRARIPNSEYDAIEAGWNAAKRYGPIPPKVTEEMVTAARAFYGATELDNDHEITRGAIAAALAASPKDNDQ